MKRPAHLPHRGLATPLLALAALLLATLPARAGEVVIPLTLEPRHLDTAVAKALELDANGRAALAENSCNRVEVAAPSTRIDQQFLQLELQLTVTTGVELMGGCANPDPWHGRMVVTLEPSVDVSGLAVKFHPATMALVRADGTEGLLSQPVRALVESLLLPQLGLMRVDLAGPLGAIDGLLAEVMGSAAGAAPALAERTRIKTLQVVPEGLEAKLQFTVAPRTRIAAAEPPLDPAELTQWSTVEDELDGFLTIIITLLAEAAKAPDLRYELLGVLLDARYAIALALTENQPEGDPIRSLFIDAWNRLRPHLGELESLPVPGFDQDLRLIGFIAGGDALRALDALGPEYGIEINRDGLRRLARLLLAEGAPASFTPLPLEVNQRLQRLFQLDSDPSASQSPPLVETLVRWLVPAAWAAQMPEVAYQVPKPAQLQTYLEQIAALLEFQASDRIQRSKKIPERLTGHFGILVSTTAWKESCWRQFTGTPRQPKVLRSPVGALGIMQINGRVWRGLYDLGRLADDVGYNIAAGTEILEHYLADYALRRGEHRQPGGDDNLMRATYAAYNGGPGQLSRYRRTDTPKQLRAIDNVFWDYYQQVRAKGEPEISTCYPVVS